MTGSVRPGKISEWRWLDVAVASVGVAGVAGVTARQTLHELLGGGAAPPPSPFRRVTDDPDADVRVDVLYAPWLGAWTPVADRLVSLALVAAEDALEIPTAEGPERYAGRIGLVLVLPPARPELSTADIDRVQSEIRSALGCSFLARYEGDAGLFPALREAAQSLARREVDSVLVVAVDSLATIEEARRQEACPSSHWRPDEPTPGEAGVALLLMRQAEAHQRGIAMATILAAETRAGTANETNEERVDGLPMTALLHQVRAHGPFRHVFSQESASPLREREWALALSRNLGVVVPNIITVKIENTLGRLGAAMAPASLALVALGVWVGAIEPAGPALVWAISDDGIRGVCALSTRSAQGTRLEHHVAFVGGPTLRLQRMGGARWPVQHLRPCWDPPAPSDDPLVQLDPKVGAPLALLPDLVKRLRPMLDDVMILGRHRMVRQYTDSRRTELRIVRRLHRLVAAGQPGRTVVRSWWEEQLGETNPWRSWALALALGIFEHGLEELAGWLAMLPPDAREDAQRAGEAMALLPREALFAGALGAMERHDHPVVRAAAFVASARLGLAGWDRVEEVLSRAATPVDVDVALWEAAYVPEQPPPRVAEILRGWVASLDARLAWHASRAALVHGDPSPYRWVVSDHVWQQSTPERPSLAQVLGPRAVEMVALVGRSEDSGTLQRWLRKSRPTPAVLDALARFGNVEIWAYLVAQLSDEDLAESAARALEILFGQRVPEVERQNAASWRDAIAKLDLDPRRRTRLGVRFAPAVFASEVDLGEASREGLEARQVELSARYHRFRPRALHGTAAETSAALSEVGAQWGQVGSDTAGQWV
jgi:hypothetical protein